MCVEDINFRKEWDPKTHSHLNWQEVIYHVHIVQHDKYINVPAIKNYIQTLVQKLN